MRQSHLWLGIVSLAVVLWLLVLQVDRATPGPLATTHAAIVELRGRRSCKHCHGRGEDDMARACGECHAVVAQQIAAANGFHGTLQGVAAERCGTCHLEHLGGDFPLVSETSFRRAGFASRASYDHAALDFTLLGRHAQLACAGCHAGADLLVLAEGQRRFQGLDQACDRCHTDAHEGRIVRDCAECHGQEHPFTLVASFRHERFESECAHATPACITCHPRGSPQDAEVLAGRDPGACRRTCADCHASAHAADFLAAVAVMARVPEGNTCARCHSESNGTFAGHPEATPPLLHAASGFPLDAPHNRIGCDACHSALPGDSLEGFTVQVPARSADECATCHGDPHGGQFDERFPGEGCLACHAREHFEPSTFGIAEHARTAFALEDSHQAVACARCHEAPHPGAARVFHGTDASCASCHADAHAGALANGDERFAAAEGGCAHCHRATLFSDFVAERFDHERWTGYALDGAHARADCEGCHPRSTEPDAAGRTFGVAARVFGASFEACSACHADPHGGRFDRAGLPAKVQGENGCARCHTTEAFADAGTATFEHERWTGYPIADFHAAVECSECHVPAAEPDAQSRAFGRAPTRCVDCHSDPHVGQFALAGATDCTRCHQDAGGLFFDHRRDSRFPLDDVHASLDCAACHVPWPLPDGGQAVRYKPLGTECVDCHDPDFVERSRGKVRRRHAPRELSPRGGVR